MSIKPHRFGLAAVVGVVAVAVGWLTPLGAARTGRPQTTMGAASLLSNVYYRPLTVFSRGGRVTAVAGVPSNDHTYYMGSAGGVFKTTDAGETWVPISDGQIDIGSIGQIAVAPSNESVVYVGTGTAEPRGNVQNGDGMYKSTDAGATWQHIGLEKAGLIGGIVIDPANPDLVYVAVVGNIFGANPERGVYRTRDGGKTWEQVLKVSENTGAADITMDPQHPTTLIASMWAVRRQPWTIDSGYIKEGGIYRTTDGGDTWQKLTTGLPTGRTGKIGVSISAANPKRVYALIEADQDQGGVYRSDDGGDTWARTYANRELQQRAFYYTRIFADPVDADLVYATNTGAFKSTDGGKTFQALRPPHGDNHDWWINPKNHLAMIESNDGGANVSLDGGETWSTEDNQPTQEIYRIAVDNRWPYYVYGAQQDNSSVAVPSSNAGQVNLSAGPGEAGYLQVDPRNFNIVYAGNYGGTLVRQDFANGTSENIRVYADEETGQRAADMKYRFQWNAPVRLSPHNPDILYTTSQYVHKSTDGGRDWQTISPDLTRNDKTKQDYAGVKGITNDDTGVEVYDTIFAFEESPVTPGLLWAGSDDGLLHLSRDDGKSWKLITPPGLPEWATINDIDLSPTEAGHAIVTAYRFMLNDYTPYAYETRDYGATWTRIADGTHGIPADAATRVVRADPWTPGLLVAGTERRGMFVSYDDGAHWESLQLNLPAVPVMDVKFYRHNLILATEGRGFWILDDLPVVEGAKPGAQAAAGGILFKPADGYRVSGGGGRGGFGGGGGAAVPPPTFYYWLKNAPTSALTLEVTDGAGRTVCSATAEPGSGEVPQPPDYVPSTAPAGRGGFGAGGRGANANAGRGGAAPAGRGRGAGAPAPGRGRAGGGRGAFGGAACATATAHQGLNVVEWSNLRMPALFTVPPGTTMWGGGNSPGPTVAPGTYAVKVSEGGWSQSQQFRLNPDPRYQPVMTDADGQAQVEMAVEVGGWVKTLYDNLAKIRSVKQQAAESAAKTPAVTAAATTLTQALVAVEGDMTQLKGEANQDALNFPGRLDNQLIALYSNVTGSETKLGTPETERYADLKPQYEALMKRADTVLTTDVATFNAAATKAGAATVVIK